MTATPIAVGPTVRAPLILASTSRYRRELLERLRLPFRCENPAIDESERFDEAPRDRAARLALAKARAVADRQPKAVVLGSDQVCALGAKILRKPGNAATNREQLRALSANTATFFTGVAVVSLQPGLWKQHVDETRCIFRSLTDDEIEAYVDAEQAFDCAGGFKFEGLGITLLERIETADPTALIGLPLIWTASALRACAVMPLSSPR